MLSQPISQAILQLDSGVRVLGATVLEVHSQLIKQLVHILIFETLHERPVGCKNDSGPKHEYCRGARIPQKGPIYEHQDPPKVFAKVFESCLVISKRLEDGHLIEGRLRVVSHHGSSNLVLSHVLDVLTCLALLAPAIS